jgi:ribosomal protein S8
MVKGFSSFASSLKNALSQCRPAFACHYTKFNSLICEYFYRCNFFSELYYLRFKSKTFIFVRIDTIENQLILSNIKILFKPSTYLFFQVSDLKRLLKKERRVLLLSTSEGVMNSVEAVHLGIGGIALLEYY